MIKNKALNLVAFKPGALSSRMFADYCALGQFTCSLQSIKIHLAAINLLYNN